MDFDIYYLLYGDWFEGLNIQKPQVFFILNNDFLFFFNVFSVNLQIQIKNNSLS